MDDLYDNLENYHDEKIVYELKSENEALKAKLEEYSSAMTRLQMDFDKLNSEYKNLEMNYSSLLKTARAEIERKSEMIKSLNTEKDLLIIKSLQNSGTNFFNPRRPFYDAQRLKKSPEIDSKCGAKPGPQPSNQNEEKRDEIMMNNDRIKSTHTQSEYTIPDLENKSNFSEDKELLRDSHINFRNKTDKSKENLTNNIHKDDPVKRKVEKISKRRKSMPYGRNIEPVFSSDDDFEALSLKSIRKSPLREDIRHFDKRNDENCSNKDRFYMNKTNRYITQGKHSYDRHESGSKYNRHSPEKYRSKYTNQHSETHRSRGDYKNRRQRVLRSPPIDKYNRSKSRDRRNFERESYYDNQEQKHSAHIHDKSAVKIKSKNELNEPSSKRQKTEQNKKGSIELNDKEREHNLRGSLTKQDFMEPSSCQSPDYVNIENSVPQYVVKEIKDTAATPLEDPRILSKKYVIKNNKDKTVLATVTSADVDLKPITVSAWNIPNIKRFMIPPRLPTEQLPPKTDNGFVNGINVDIDSVLLNDSLESGEIQIDYDNYYKKDSDVDKWDENKKSNEDHNKTSNTLTDIDSDNIKNNKYKIPKIKKPDKMFTAVKHEDFGLLSKKENPAIKYGNENIELETENYGNVSTSIRANVTPYTKNEMIKISTVLPEKTLACTLAEDLELSDEATETLHNNSKKSIKIVPKRKSSMDSVDLNKQKQHVTSINDEIINSEKSKPITQLKKTSKDSSKDSGKTRKSKKKTEIKVTPCTETKEQKELQADSKFNSKNINSKPAISIETKNKFSDLFGDSSSLITPDDLGLPHPESKLPLTDKYVSIYDNTQDAVDLSVADINGKQFNASKLNTFPTLREDQLNEKTVIENVRNDTEKPQVYKDFVENTKENNLPEKNSCEKAAMNDSEILKTVIISTGIQPKYTSESIPAQESKESDIEPIDKIINVKTNMKTCMLNNIKALATSTPQKIEHVDISTPLTEPSAAPFGTGVPNGAADAITDNTNLSNNVSNASNPDEILNEADVPDVRIFVKRRRKIIRKP